MSDITVKVSISEKLLREVDEDDLVLMLGHEVYDQAIKLLNETPAPESAKSLAEILDQVHRDTIAERPLTGGLIMPCRCGAPAGLSCNKNDCPQ